MLCMWIQTLCAVQLTSSVWLLRKVEKATVSSVGSISEVSAFHMEVLLSMVFTKPVPIFARLSKWQNYCLTSSSCHTATYFPE